MRSGTKKGDLSVYLSSLDRRLLTLLQDGLPLVAEPFAEIGKKLGLSEGEVIERTRELKENQVIRRLGGIFDTRGLGYASTLVAMSVPPDRLEEVARVVNAHQGVTHNYVREHPRYNLWFTLIAKSEEEIEASLCALVKQTGIRDMMNLPTRKTFKIGAKFDLG